MLEQYRTGDKEGAADSFARWAIGSDYRAWLDRLIPGAIQQVVGDADTFFGHELPALRKWTFGPDEARRITQPVLAVVGENSDSRFHQRQELLLRWLPNVEPFVLRSAGHLLHLENRHDLADGLVAFLARHPIAVPA